MLSILFNILFCFEILSLGSAMVWLAKLYFSNQTYIRDIYLILALFFCILLNITTIFNNFEIIPILVMMIIQLNSMFLLTRVESSRDKWKSNIYKAFSFFFALYAIVSQNWFVYFVSFTLVTTIEVLFSLKIDIKKSIKIINQITYLSAFLAMYCYYQNKVGNFNLIILNSSVLFLNIMLCSKCFCRIKQIRDYNI